MLETKNKMEVAIYSALPQRAGQVIKVDAQELVLFRLSNGEVKAVENRSPHPKGGTLCGGLVSGEYVYCPVYDWKISLETGLVQAPDEGQVKTFPVVVEEDRVFIII